MEQDICHARTLQGRDSGTSFDNGTISRGWPGYKFCWEIIAISRWKLQLMLGNHRCFRLKDAESFFLGLFSI
jgi:hypothetical protein